MLSYKIEKKDKTEFFFALVIIFIVLFSRYIFFESDWSCFSTDPGNCALAVKDYSLEDFRPHLPGYFLYVQMIKTVNIISGNTHSSVMILMLLFSAISSLLFFGIFRRFADNLFAFILTMLVFTNPYIWFFNCCAENYTFDLFFGSLIIYLALTPKNIFWIPPAFGLLSGIRQGSAVLLIPLMIYIFYTAIKEKEIRIPKIILSFLIGFTLLFAWLIPMIVSAGGIDGYIRLLSTKSPVVMPGPLKNLSAVLGFSVFLFLPLFFAFIFFPYYRITKRILNQIKNFAVKENRNLFLLFYLFVPPNLFFIFMTFSKGYLLLSCGAIFIFLALLRKHCLIRKRFLIIILIFQTIVFLYLPYKVPSDEVNFTTSQKKLSTLEIFSQRLQSGFSPTLSHLEKFKYYYREVDSAINFLEKQSCKTLFIDPSMPVFPRILEVRYPAMVFYTYNPFSSDTYFEYSGIDFKTNKLRTLNPESVAFAGTKTFLSKYADLNIEHIFETENFAFYKIHNEQLDSLISIYRKYYSREK